MQLSIPLSSVKVLVECMRFLGGSMAASYNLSCLCCCTRCRSGLLDAIAHEGKARLTEDPLCEHASCSAWQSILTAG